MEWSSGAGSGLTPPSQGNVSYFSYTASQHSPNDVSAVALDTGAPYTESSCYADTADSSNVGWVPPSRTLDFHSQGSSSSGSDPEYYHHQVRSNTPPSSSGEGPYQQATDDFQDHVVVGNALIDFQGLDAAGRGMQP
jgi:hypothetical protein